MPNEFEVDIVESQDFLLLCDAESCSYEKKQLLFCFFFLCFSGEKTEGSKDL